MKRVVKGNGRKELRMLFLLLMFCWVSGRLSDDRIGVPLTAYAETEVVLDEAAVEKKTASEAAEAEQAAVSQETEEAGEAATGQAEVRPFTFRDWFGLVFCCALGIGICLWVALYGDPKERERLRNKKIRKQLEEEEKMKALREEIKRKKAEEAAQTEIEKKA